jgi:hypothetical protein
MNLPHGPLFIVALLSLLCSKLSFAWQSSGQAGLIELYTSEGCSSCPPADAWVSSLKARPGLWKDFVPVVFHVDYWDNLGWPDKFAKPSFAARQRAYARLWKTSTVYTPAVVIQGLQSGLREQGLGVRESLQASWSLNELQLTTSVAAPAIVHAAWLAMDVRTDVKRGENAGKTLVHNFVVLEHQVLGANEKSKKWRLSPPTSSAAPIAALAVWLEVDNKPVVATGGPFDPRAR